MATLAQPVIARRATTPRLKFSRFALYGVAVLLVLLLTWPFFWAVSSSLKDVGEITVRPPRWLPAAPQWGNYVEIWKTVPLGRFVLNSLIVTVAAMIGQIASCTAVAYGFARFRFPGRNMLFGLALATLLLPREVTIIPQYMMFRELGWLDTFLPLIVPFWFSAGAGAFTIFLMRQFFMTIPYDLDEAARIDGASSFQIWWRMLLPLSAPALGTVGVFSVLASWNDFLGPLIYMNKPDMRTMALGLQFFVGQYGTRWNQLMAVAVVMTLPIVALFFFAQRFFMRGIAMTGITGR